MTIAIFNEEAELNLKAIITDEFIQASKNILADVIKTSDINKLSIDEQIKIGNDAFNAECNRVYYIGKLEEIAIAAGKVLTEREKRSIETLNNYFNLVSAIYPVAAAQHIAFNPNVNVKSNKGNTISINAVHNFALIDAKRKAYSIYENTIKETAGIITTNITKCKTAVCGIAQ